MSDLHASPLDALHRSLGARMGPFAGYDLPLRYEPGALAEHLHTRSQASLFDVSHMGIVHVVGPSSADTAAALETVVPGDIAGLEVGRSRYTCLTNTAGGVLDDLIVTNSGDHHTLVVNGATKADDLDHLRNALPGSISVAHRDDLALIALQGPSAAEVIATFAPQAAELVFMQSCDGSIAGAAVGVSRSGYTGEDGFELTVVADDAEAVARALLDNRAVEPAGLAARDSLRLEAGLCLYGNDLTVGITPIEAGLTWSIPKHRRGADAGYPGCEVVAGQIAHGPPRRRVGLAPDGRRPIRADAELRTPDGTGVGITTSGGFGPSADAPIAMGLVASDHTALGTSLVADVRGRDEVCTVVPLPFVAHRYAR